MDKGYVISSFNIKSLDNSEANLLPCHFDTDVKLKSNPFHSSMYLERGYKCASLRGRPLYGQIVDLPSGFVGCVVNKVHESGEGKEMLSVSKKFDRFTCWNLDFLPPKEDTVTKALMWTNISESIHSMDTN